MISHFHNANSSIGRQQALGPLATHQAPFAQVTYMHEANKAWPFGLKVGGCQTLALWPQFRSRAYFTELSSQTLEASLRPGVFCPCTPHSNMQMVVQISTMQRIRPMNVRHAAIRLHSMCDAAKSRCNKFATRTVAGCPTPCPDYTCYKAIHASNCTQ